jgi:hypothetical protein
LPVRERPDKSHHRSADVLDHALYRSEDGPVDGLAHVNLQIRLLVRAIVAPFLELLSAPILGAAKSQLSAQSVVFAGGSTIV